MSFRAANSFGKFSFVTLALLMNACGGNQKEAEPSPQPEASQTPPAEENVTDDEAALLAEIEASADAADAEAAATDSGGKDEREVVYRVSQDGLKIQINGAEFIPKAEAVKVAGRWGVKLTIEATAEGERLLLAPRKGPLAFGGVVDRGSPSKFGDKREGGGDMKIIPGQSLTFSRTWPDGDQKGLAPGEKLELHVGLWGYGVDEANRRPVNRLLVIKMVADQAGAQPLIQPPGQ
jgi:hypothetical protein